MQDPNQILQQVQQHTSPPNWEIVPAKQAYFLQTLFGGIALVVLALAAAGYLVLNPDFVIGLRGFVNLDTLQGFWRIMDFVVCGAIVVSGGILIRNAMSGMAMQDQQMLVLLPDGFVMQKGTTSKTMAAIAYASVRTPKVVVRSGTTYLLMARASGEGALQVTLDGRFGPPKQIAKRIIDAHQVFARARVNG